MHRAGRGTGASANVFARISVPELIAFDQPSKFNPMNDKIEVLVAEALTNVKNPRVDKDVISAGMVVGMKVSNGVVAFDFLLDREDSPQAGSRG